MFFVVVPVMSAHGTASKYDVMSTVAMGAFVETGILGDGTKSHSDRGAFHQRKDSLTFTDLMKSRSREIGVKS